MCSCWAVGERGGEYWITCSNIVCIAASWAFCAGGGGGVLCSIFMVVWNMASWNWSVVVVFSCLYLVGADFLNCLDLLYSVRVLVSSFNLMLLAGCSPNFCSFVGCCGA